VGAGRAPALGPPRPPYGGRHHTIWDRACLAAIAAAPAADVIVVAHSGLEHVIPIGDVWRVLPREQVLMASWWRVPVLPAPAVRRLVDAPLSGRRAAIGRRAVARARQQLWRAEAETWISRLC
jgi:hypothetical protein